MALTLTKLSNPNPDYVEGNKRVRVRKVTFDSSYATGGESLVASDVRLKKIQFVRGGVAINSEGAGDSTRAIRAHYNLSTNKLQAFWYDPSQASAEAFREVANTTDLSTYAGVFEFVGY